jgi:hypothetical protein
MFEMILTSTLFTFYPSSFKIEFADEIHDVLMHRMDEAKARSKQAWLAAAVQEISQLVISIWRECRHVQKSHKEKR